MRLFQWKMCRTDSAVGVTALLYSWERHLSFTVPLNTQVYIKWVPANLMVEVTLWWTSISSREELRWPGARYWCTQLKITHNLALVNLFKIRSCWYLARSWRLWISSHWKSLCMPICSNKGEYSKNAVENGAILNATRNIWSLTRHNLEYLWF